MVTVSFRPVEPGDETALTGGQSEFDDFGPFPAPPPSPRWVQLAIHLRNARRGGSSAGPPGLEQTGKYAVLCDGELAGRVTWTYVRWGPTTASTNPMISTWLIPAYRGKGVGTQAKRMLADLFFAHTAVNRVEAHADADNVAVHNALERAGFTQEGVVRGAHWRLGKHRDLYLYSILRADAVSGPTANAQATESANPSP